jgi:hypothetical protein
MIVTLEHFLNAVEEKPNPLILNTFNKQLTRLKNGFDRHVVRSAPFPCALLIVDYALFLILQKKQIDDIEQTKLSSKKRQGVAYFVKQFPVYVKRVEAQLVGAEGLDIRTNVDTAYEKIVNTIFDSLKHMAKMGGEDEDKGQLNYHVIIIGVRSPISLILFF